MAETVKLVFATNNAHKLEEVREILSGKMEILSLKEVGCTDDIPETAGTLEGNALQKARWVKQRYGYDCFADDTGLEVDALGGEPGVNSARFAAINGVAADHDSQANMELLLRKLSGTQERKARFRTVIAYVADSCGEKLFEGCVEGEITEQPHGTAGFGYDPVFRPLETGLTFAQMSAEAKNAISHRGRAMAAFKAFLDKA